MLVVVKQPLKGVENYYNDALLYADAFKADSHSKEPDSRNEADIESKPAEECVWELDLSACI